MKKKNPPTFSYANTEYSFPFNLKDDYKKDSVIYKTNKQEILQSVFFFKKYIPDFYLFGRLAANHSWSVFASTTIQISNITPILFLPEAKENIMQDHIEKILLGAKHFF